MDFFKLSLIFSAQVAILNTIYVVTFNRMNKILNTKRPDLSDEVIKSMLVIGFVPILNIVVFGAYLTLDFLTFINDKRR